MHCLLNRHESDATMTISGWPQKFRCLCRDNNLDSDYNGPTTTDLLDRNVDYVIALIVQRWCDRVAPLAQLHQPLARARLFTLLW